MNIVPTALAGVLIIEPKVFGDDRGFFTESYNQRVFDDAVGHAVGFVQDNHSRSQQGVLRGLHYQVAPHAQGKLVRAVSGAIFDVAVDLREESPTLGRWVGVELSSTNRRQLWVPRGLAHGFLVLTASADVLYKTDSYYAPAADAGIRWDDPTLAIDWPLPAGRAPLLSAKDAAAPAFSARRR